MWSSQASGSHGNVRSGWVVRSMGDYSCHGGFLYRGNTTGTSAKDSIYYHITAVGSGKVSKDYTGEHFTAVRDANVCDNGVKHERVCLYQQGRAMSKTMRKALKIITLVQEAFSLTFISHHLRTEDSEVAYRLSLGYFKEVQLKR